PTVVAPHGVDATGVEALEERNVRAACDRIRGADARAEPSDEAAREALVAAAFGDEAQEREIPAEESAHRLDGYARAPSGRWIEEIVDVDPVDADAEPGEDP